MTEQTPKVDDAILKKLVPIGALPKPIRLEVLEHARLEELQRGEYVFREGDNADDTVYLLGGELQLFAGEQLVAAVRGDTDAARHPLSPSRPRSQSARARELVTVLRLDRALLDQKLTWFQSIQEQRENAASTEAGEWMTRLSRASLFTRIPAAHIQKIFTYLQPVAVREGDTIVTQGAEGDYYYVVEEGRCAVSRRPSGQAQEVKLAELGVGDGFGEQALLSEGRHSATVTMLTDGVLGRLAKDAFVSLIKRPVLRGIDIDRAQSMVRDGAVWLDVRLPEEHEESGLKDSVNVPLARLRQEAKTLRKDRSYIVYCDSGERSSAATYLLSQNGFDARLLDGGLMGLTGTKEMEAGDPENTAAVPSLKADITLSQLKVALAQVRQQVEMAVHRRVDREALIRANREETERLRHQHKLDKTAVKAITDRLEDERRQVEEEAEQTESSLRRARRTQMQLETAKQRAEKEATKQRAAVRKLKSELDKKLRDGKRRLEAEYSQASKRLQELGRLKERAASELTAERDRLQAQFDGAAKRLEALDRKRISARADQEAASTALAELDRESNKRLADLEHQQKTLRAEAEKELQEGRAGLEAELAQNLQLLDHARREQEEAEAAQRVAEAEAARIAAESKAAEERIRKETAARLKAERERLQREATEISRQLETAQRMKEQADAARRAAAERMSKLRAAEEDAARRAQDEERIKAEVARREAEVAKAREELQAARNARADVEVSQNIVERTDIGRARVQKRLRSEIESDIEDWLKEDVNRDANSTAEVRRIEHALKHINERLDRERKEEEEYNEDMLNEIQSQLDKNA